LSKDMIPKTKIRKWLSVTLSDYGTGYKYEVKVQQRFTRDIQHIPSLPVGTQIQIHVFTRKSQHYVDSSTSETSFASAFLTFHRCHCFGMFITQFPDLSTNRTFYKIFCLHNLFTL